jgi:hypothetical protein
VQRKRCIYIYIQISKIHLSNVNAYYYDEEIRIVVYILSFFVITVFFAFLVSFRAFSLSICSHKNFESAYNNTTSTTTFMTSSIYRLNETLTRIILSLLCTGNAVLVHQFQVIAGLHSTRQLSDAECSYAADRV